jgi:hypothetical protein
MAKKKNPLPPGLGQGSGHYTQQIVKRLEHAFRYSHERPYQLFNDWTRIVEVTLEALPDQLKAVARTGQQAPDPPETAEVFAEVRARYENPHHPAAQREVWGAFGEAFALLLESAEPGLWGEGSYGRGDCGYMGPDVLGHVYMTYANADPGWRAQFFSPYNISLLLAQMTIMDGARQVYDRIKAACLHPDNLLGQAVILASLVIPDGVEAEPNLHRDYFFNKVIPAALPFLEKITIADPAGVGSGIMLLASASQYPEWAVKMNIVTFVGADIDPICCRMAKLNTYLYGLNGFALRLAEAVSVAAEAQRNRAEPLMAAPPKSVGAAIEQAAQGRRQQPDGPALPPDELSFEAFFRRAAQPVVTAEAPA